MLKVKCNCKLVIHACIYLYMYMCVLTYKLMYVVLFVVVFWRVCSNFVFLFYPQLMTLKGTLQNKLAVTCQLHDHLRCYHLIYLCRTFGAGKYRAISYELKKQQQKKQRKYQSA